ncbi:MAG: hypothetical protein H6828_09190 [Planctomycetes bacterium]|nr:hypothetical protein [Planctomycetota bacterium]
MERTLADDGAETHRAALNAAAEHAVLVAVARILHDWSPAERFLGLDLERPELLGDEDATRG